MTAGGAVGGFVVRGVDHVVGVVALEQDVEGTGAEARYLERAARMKRIHLATDVERPRDDVECVAGTKRAQIEIVDLRLARPVERAREVKQLTRKVSAERLVQDRGQR